MSNTNYDVAESLLLNSNSDDRSDLVKSSNGNFWHQNRVAYSYATPIAIAYNRKLYMTELSFSQTTAGKHKNALVKAAIKNGWEVEIVQQGVINQYANQYNPGGGLGRAQAYKIVNTAL